MTPQEKAEQIVDKYLEVLPSRNPIMYIGDIETAKQCALVAVDELMQSDWYIPTREEHNKWVQYWQEVKNEIEKL